MIKWMRRRANEKRFLRDLPALLEDLPVAVMALLRAEEFYREGEIWREDDGTWNFSEKVQIPELDRIWALISNQMNELADQEPNPRDPNQKSPALSSCGRPGVVSRG